MTKTSALILTAGIIISGAIVFWAGYSKNDLNKVSGSRDNVSISEGNQTVTILAKGGYFPRVTTAKAGIQTTLRVETKGTFDCSIALVIPSLKYRQNLQPNGSVDIPIPPQKSGTNIQGLCSMGMYNFRVDFE